MTFLSTRLKKADNRVRLPVSEFEAELAQEIKQDAHLFIKNLRLLQDSLQNISYRLEANNIINMTVYGAEGEEKPHMSPERVRAFKKLLKSLHVQVGHIKKFYETILKKLSRFAKDERLENFSKAIKNQSDTVRESILILIEKIKDMDRNPDFIAEFKNTATSLVNKEIEILIDTILENGLLSFLDQDILGKVQNISNTIVSE